MDLSQAAALADEYAQKGLERELATLRGEWADEVEHAARDQDYRVRALAYRSLAQDRGWVLVDGSGDADTVDDRVWAVVSERLTP